MKKLMFIISSLAFLSAYQVMAQVAPVVSSFPVGGSGSSAQWLLDLIAKFPKLGSVIMVIGVLRLVLKPLFAILHSVFQYFDLTAYDQKESAIEASKPISILFWLLDYLGSVKVQVPQVSDQPSKPPQQAS